MKSKTLSILFIIWETKKILEIMKCLLIFINHILVMSLMESLKIWAKSYLAKKILLFIMQGIKNMMILQKNSFYLHLILLKISKKTDFFINQIIHLKKWKILPKSISFKIKIKGKMKIKNLISSIFNLFRTFANMLLLNCGVNQSWEKL